MREAAEHDVLDGAVAAHVRQRAAEVVARPTARRAGGRDDEELGGPWRAKQAAQCEQRALVGPLQVVDDQQDRLGKRAHERVERAEDTRADPGVRRHRPCTAAQPIELGDAASDELVDRAGAERVVAVGDDLGEWPVGGERLLAATAEEDGRGATRLGGEAQREARLPDSRLTGEERKPTHPALGDHAQ